MEIMHFLISNSVSNIAVTESTSLIMLHDIVKITVQSISCLQSIKIRTLSHLNVKNIFWFAFVPFFKRKFLY